MRALPQDECEVNDTFNFSCSFRNVYFLMLAFQCRKNRKINECGDVGREIERALLGKYIVNNINLGKSTINSVLRGLIKHKLGDVFW